MLIVVALGGNALQPKESRGYPEEQWAAVRKAARALAEIVREGFEIVITHGNGPQVGYLLEAMESMPLKKPRQTLDLAVAMTQGWLGFLIAHSLEEELARLGVAKRAAVIPTRVLVSLDDPEFLNPSKPVGGYYGREEAEVLSKTLGWIFKEDPRGDYRRVVPSPRPLKILETPILKSLLEENIVPIAAGGGGIPVASVEGTLKPVEAVIDKDLASSLLAVELDADMLAILTDVPGVALNYHTPKRLWLRRVKARELKKYYERGEFPPGSMGPKVLAAIEFVEKTGRKASIGLLEEALKVVKGDSGTLIEA
ncbi:MAG: carbamate kinase [Thermoprotei archaeon]|nr:carbamate kinase [Thermoprotei archaeon]